ncbi:adhesion regulating molecule 1 [Homalodisca vitripennis]|nr:adhesion regulating molecule 1 [Homalodisca vitripennis]
MTRISCRKGSRQLILQYNVPIGAGNRENYLLVIRGTDVIWASNLELLELIFFLKEQAARSAAQRASIKFLIKKDHARCLPAAQRFALLALLEKKINSSSSKFEAQITSVPLITNSRPSTSQGRPSSTTGGSSSSSATTAAPKPAAAPAPSPPRAKPPAASAGLKTKSDMSVNGRLRVWVTAETPAQNPIQLSDLQNFLSGLGVAGTPGSSAPQNVDLSSAINTETLSAVVNNPAVVEELQQHLPSTGGEASQQEHLRSTLASPQFQQVQCSLYKC